MLTPLSINSLSQGPKWQEPLQVRQINRRDVPLVAGRASGFWRLWPVLRKLFADLISPAAFRGAP